MPSDSNEAVSIHPLPAASPYRWGPIVAGFGTIAALLASLVIMSGFGLDLTESGTFGSLLVSLIMVVILVTAVFLGYLIAARKSG